MIARKPVGQGASAVKYDVLTAMGTLALKSEKGAQRLILRLMTLITARYNWARNELAVGQREMAKLWHVNERTVKREMAKLRDMGWLSVKRQGARGRVTTYQVELDRILRDTQPQWGAIGPDFVERLSQYQAGPSEQKVVPLPIKGTVPAPDMGDGRDWDLAKARLHGEDEAVYGSWFRNLTRKERAGHCLVLEAPSRFHAGYVSAHHQDRLLAACHAVDATISQIRVVPPEA